MKYFVLNISILFFFFFTIKGWGQNSGCEVKVYSEKEPLEYVYVFINKKYFGSTDSLGLLNIPGEKLLTGDTVAVSYMGMTSGEFRYKGEKCHVFNLVPSEVLPAVHKVGDIKAFYNFYHKNVKVKLPLGKKYELNYKMEKYRDEDTIILHQGYLKVTKVKYRGNNKLDYKLNELKIEVGDSLGIDALNLLAQSYHNLLSLNQFSYVLQDKNSNITLKYLGETARYKIFSWHYFSSKNHPITVRVYADRSSKLIVKTEMTYIHLSTDKLVRCFFDFRYDEQKKETVLTRAWVCSFDGIVETDNYIRIILEEVSAFTCQSWSWDECVMLS